jgi:hypothetical protein
MKNSLITALLLLSFLTSQGQATTLKQDFNLACTSFTGLPSGWAIYNPVMGTFPDGSWHCSPTNGRDNTPGILCTGYYSGNFHLDTSFLISPQLNLSSYAGSSLFLRFDSKTTKIHQGGKLSLLVSTSPSATFTTYIDLSMGIAPIFSNEDSTDWVTHEADLSGFTSAGNMYIAFRYTSPAESGNIWFLDNINLSVSSVNVPTSPLSSFPFGIIGRANGSQITLSYTPPEAGQYQLTICDIVGRRVHQETINTTAGTTHYTLSNLNLQPGMHFLQLTNGVSNSVAKVIVE